MVSLLVVSTAITTILFALVWFICVRVVNYGFLDVTWTLSIGLLAFIDGVAGPGDSTRRALFCALGIAWSLRLGLFVLARVARHHPIEDKRYASLRERWRSPGAFLVFFELQALIAVVFSAPFLIAAFASSPQLQLLEWLGLSVVAVGILGEAIADWQANAFKQRSGSGAKLLQIGLWRYSRHPNYFFESVVWIGFALASLPLAHGWVVMACPVLILYFLLRVTGIPLTEKHSLEAHGDAYRDYQRSTSAFVPWMKLTRRAE